MVVTSLILSNPAWAAAPRGVFVLNDDNKPWPIPEQALRDPRVDGASLRLRWELLEPEQRRFDWGYFDRELERAKRAGKPVFLRAYTAFQGHAPDWVYQSGAKRFDFRMGKAMDIPVPWDPVFLGEWTRLIEAMGKRYAAEPAVVLVQMAGLDYTGGEMHLPKTPRDKERWRGLGYRPDLLIGAWKKVIDAYAEAFPGKYLAIDVSLPIERDGVVEEVLAYAQARIGDRLCVQHNALAAKTAEDGYPHRWVVSMKGRAVIGFQQLCPVTPRGAFNEWGARYGGTLERSLEIGLKAGMSYLEAYLPDLAEPSLRPAWTNLEHALRSRSD